MIVNITMTMLLIVSVTILGLSWIPFLCYFAKRERIHEETIAELTAKLTELNKSQEDKDFDSKKYN